MNCARIRILSSSMLLTAAFSCQTPNVSSDLGSVASGAPAKPNDLPKTSVNFGANDMVAIYEHGSSICKMLEKDKTEDFVRMAQKVCDTDSRWLGYTTADGLKDNNELFIGNREALTALGNKISALAGQRSNIAIQRLAHLEMTALRDDLTMISGEKIKKFESEVQKAPYASFSTWARSLNDYYMKHGSSNGAGVM